MRADIGKASAAYGIPPNPIADSLGAATVDIWFFHEKEKGLHALDAAYAQVPLRNLPIEQRPYFTFAAFYALAGRPDKGRAVLAQYDADVRDPAARRVLEPSRESAMGEILIAEKKPLEAVKQFWASDSLPDGPSSGCAHCGDSDLGRAYDAASMPDSAIFYYERYLKDVNERNWSRDGTLLPGIYKRLGELYEAKNDPVKAEGYYTQFVDLWKNADPELQPQVADVRRRIAVLQAHSKG
jgi:tetratricopeptide (TPR) repeat protein